MSDITPDLYDKYGDSLQLLNTPLQNFGGRHAFWGQIVTVRCYHDNSKVREVLSTPGQGKVLVVDGNGSLNQALLGDQLAILAIENGWEGILVYGAIRDVFAMAQMDLGVKALGSSPIKTLKRDKGETDVSVSLAGQRVYPGDYIYSDWNGIFISKQELEVS